MEKLKPCPFCDGAAEITALKTGTCIICSVSQCANAVAAKRHRAIALWNSRPQSEVERLALEVVKLWPWAGVYLTPGELAATAIITSPNLEDMNRAIHALAAAVQEADRV